MIEAGVLFQQAVAALRRDRRASYRLQLGAALGFDEVAALGPYLDALGVSDVYLSPCFRCGPGSSHGYDVTDHNTFNPELGSAASFDRTVTMEWLTEGQRVEDYSIEALQNGAWKKLAHAQAIGHKKIDIFPPVTTQRVRLNLLSTVGSAAIREFQLFNGSMQTR